MHKITGTGSHIAKPLSTTLKLMAHAHSCLGYCPITLASTPQKMTALYLSQMINSRYGITNYATLPYRNE